MRKVRFSTVEREIMDDVFDPESLVAHDPNIKDVLDGGKLLRDVLDEAHVVGKFQKANGFLGDKSMQRVCKYNMAAQLMMEEFHNIGCTCGRAVMGADGHKEWFYLWLDGPGKAFDLRSKIVV